MIGIFSGRGMSEDTVFAKLDVKLREHLHLFNNGKNTNALAVFLCIALHSDENGWAFPGRESIKKYTGITTEAAITQALAHLKAMRVNGHRIFEHYRLRMDDGTFGQSIYLIFPDIPHTKCPLGKAVIQNPPPHDDPLMDEPSAVDHALKEEPLKEEPLKRAAHDKFDDMVDETPRQSPTPILTAEQRKDNIAKSLSHGYAKHLSMKDRWLACFSTRPNWQTKTYGRILNRLKESDEIGEPIETFAEWWYAHDWRGQNGRPPIPTQVDELWPQAFTEKQPKRGEVFTEVY